jgi:hypothetical protein
MLGIERRVPNPNHFGKKFLRLAVLSVSGIKLREPVPGASRLGVFAPKAFFE